MKIIAYTWNAGVHCPGCTCEAADVGLLSRQPPMQLSTDEHGLAFDVIDHEGNPAHPVFTTDEHDLTHCSDCHESLE